MALIAALDTLVTVAFSAALPLFALGVYQYRDCPFGAVLLVFPLVLLFSVLTLSIHELSVSPTTARAATMTFVIAGATLAVIGAVRIFRLSTGRWSI